MSLLEDLREKQQTFGTIVLEFVAAFIIKNLFSLIF